MRLAAPRSPLAAPVSGIPFPLPRAAPFTMLATPLPRARWVRMIRLDEQDILRVRSSHGGTSHELLLGVLTGALRTWPAAANRWTAPGYGH